MAMTSRERLLAIGVGVTVGLLGLQYGISSISAKLTAKQALIDAARKDADSLQLQITKGMISQKKVNALKAKSFPSNADLLNGRYREWLTQVGEEVGLTGEDFKIGTQPRPVKSTSAYTAYKATMQVQCRTDQLIDLMAKFYEKDLLHTITSLKVTSTPQPNWLNVSLDSQAIALRVADAKQPFSSESSKRLPKTAEEYKQSILGRNPFAPPNSPPALATAPRQEVKRGEAWSLKLEGKDPESHLVKFEMVSKELPPGLNFSDRSGEISWKPEANGDYEVVVRATDDGLPAKSADYKLAFKVVDPPPPPAPTVEPPKFDAASQSRVTALVGGRDGPEVWVRSLTEGKSFQLSEGEDFEVGSIKAKVVSINLKESFAEFETDGMRWLVGMDSTLKEAFEKSKAD